MKSIYYILFIILSYSPNLWGQNQIVSKDSLQAIADKVDALTVKKVDFTSATSELIRGIQLAEEAGDNRILAILYTHYSRIHLQMHKFKEGLDASEKSVEYADISQDTSVLARAYYGLGILQFSNARIASDEAFKDTAIATLKKSAKLYTQINDDINSAKSIAKIGNILDSRGKFVEANVLYQQLLTIAEANQDTANMEIANIFLAANYFYQKQFDKALPYAKNALTNAENKEKTYQYGRILDVTREIYKAKKDYKSAMIYVELSEEHNDSLLNAQQTAQILELNTKYETEKKELVISQQKTELELNDTRERNLFGIGALFLLLAGAALYAFRNKQKSNLALEEKNKEISTLLGEVHHRVKNNLQILSSLLHLQSRHITDDLALSAVKEGQTRVEAMGLIHQKLYTRNNDASIQINEYLRDLGDMVTDSLAQENQIEILYDTPKLYLDVDTAIPLGLIINELITNSLKYGFPNKKKGEIKIKLAISPLNLLCLTVSDNGIGKQENPNKKSTEFGTQLIHILCKKLKGDIKVLKKAEGYGTEICFAKWK